jgi:hypothetical protein
MQKPYLMDIGICAIGASGTYAMKIPQPTQSAATLVNATVGPRSMRRSTSGAGRRPSIATRR